MRYNYKICKILILILFLSGVTQISAQEMVKTKDGLPIMERNEFLSMCVNSFADGIKESGLSIDANKLCSCMMDDFIPSFNSWEFPDLSTIEFEDILKGEKGTSPLLECFAKSSNPSGSSLDDDDSENKNWLSGLVKESCMEALNDGIDFTQAQAEMYCNCASQKLVSGEYSLDDLNDLDNENSAAFNEIILQCMEDIISPENGTSHNIYNPDDIKGRSSYTDVKLTSLANQGNKVKLEIGGVSHYYLIDTGASDLIIDRNLERTLLMNGTIKEENYLDREIYMTADNREIYGQNIWVDNVKIGDYTVNNVIIVVIDDGGFLLGMGFLNKFSKWEILKDKKVLRLYK